MSRQTTIFFFVYNLHCLLTSFVIDSRVIKMFHTKFILVYQIMMLVYLVVQKMEIFIFGIY